MEFPIINSQFEHVNTFINTLAPIVVNEYVRRKKNGDKLIFPATCIGQAALESGWNLGASTLFGIKGEGVIANTQEYVDGAYIDIVDSFQHYPSIAEAVVGYYDLMQWDNYDDATSANTVEEELEGLTNDIGYAYATSPTYKENVLSIINDYGLRAFNDYALSLFEEPTVDVAEPIEVVEELPIMDGKAEVLPPQQNVNEAFIEQMLYHIGDTVEIKGIFKTCRDNVEYKPAPSFEIGVICDVQAGAENPYRIGECTGWVNDNCIVRKISSAEPTTQTINVGSNVRFIGVADYDGTPITAWSDSYIIKEINGDRVVLANSDDVVFCACHIEDVELV